MSVQPLKFKVEDLFCPVKRHNKNIIEHYLTREKWSTDSEVVVLMQGLAVFLCQYKTSYYFCGPVLHWGYKER